MSEVTEIKRKIKATEKEIRHLEKKLKRLNKDLFQAEKAEFEEQNRTSTVRVVKYIRTFISMGSYNQCRSTIAHYRCPVPDAFADYKFISVHRGYGGDVLQVKGHDDRILFFHQSRYFPPDQLLSLIGLHPFINDGPADRHRIEPDPDEEVSLTIQYSYEG